MPRRHMESSACRYEIMVLRHTSVVLSMTMMILELKQWLFLFSLLPALLACTFTSGSLSLLRLWLFILYHGMNPEMMLGNVVVASDMSVNQIMCKSGIRSGCPLGVLFPSFSDCTGCGLHVDRVRKCEVRHLCFDSPMTEPDLGMIHVSQSRHNL